MERNWQEERHDQPLSSEPGRERRTQGFDAHKDWLQHGVQEDPAFASSSTYREMGQGQQPAYGVPYPSMGDGNVTSTGFMEEGNNPYSTYGYSYGDVQLASREARNVASLGSETDQQRGMANYLEAESQLLATQKAEVAMRGAHMEDEMGGTGDPVLLNPLQILHAHEAELLQIQHQQQREELQTAYGLQDYEKFIVNNPGKSVHVYIDTVLKEETGKSRSQLNTEYAKRGASASADINGILIRKTGKSRSKLENAVLKIEKGKTKYFLRNEKLKNETGKSISQMRNKESRNKTGKSLDKLRDEKLMEETGKSRVEMRTEAKKSGKSYKEIYEASAQAYQRPFE